MSDEENEQPINQIALDALTELFEATPDLDARHLLVSVDQLQRLLHEVSIYLGKLSQAALALPFFPLALPTDDQDLAGACYTLAAICHYVSCQHQDIPEPPADPWAEESAQRKEQLEWPQQPPFQVFE